MAEQLVEETDAFRRYLSTSVANPDGPGGWRRERYEYKPGHETADTIADTLRGLAAQALATNSTYLAIASPSAAQVAAQVRVLTRESTALIRLLLGLLDTTEGT